MAHSYLDKDLYKKHVIDHIKREVDCFMKNTEKIINTDLDDAQGILITMAFNNGVRSGFLCLSIGVGTVTIYILQSLISSLTLVNCILLAMASFTCFSESSNVLSIPERNSSIRHWAISNPTTSYFAENAWANGNPTYPNPITAIL